MNSANVTQFAPSPVAMFATAVWYGFERNKWLGPFFDASAPDYLTCEYPGDHGWDAAGLAANPTIFAAYPEAELTHARWAMFDTLGCLTPELLAKYAGVQFHPPVWFKAGAQIFPEGGLDFFGSPNLVHAQSIHAIVACHFVPVGAFETYCVKGGPLRMDLDLLHPAEAFDPLVLADDFDIFAKLKLRSRISMFGYYVQTIATREGFVETWASHIADPFVVKGMNNANVTQFASSLVAMFATAVWYGRERNKWLGPFSDASTPDYLTCEYPGDYGWDAAGSAANPTIFAAYREAELTHACWAMFDTLGCLTPELLAKYAGVQFHQPVWFKAGAQISPEGGLDFFGSPNLVHAHSIHAIVAYHFVPPGAFETYCVKGGPLRMDLDLLHPGEAFDPVVLADD